MARLRACIEGSVGCGHACAIIGTVQAGGTAIIARSRREQAIDKDHTEEILYGALHMWRRHQVLRPIVLGNLPGWRWARIKQLALVGSRSSLHSGYFKALGGSDGVGPQQNF